jgi:glutaminyl-peptide cyclotransferase
MRWPPVRSAATVLVAALLLAGAAGAATPLPGAPFDGRYAYELTKLQVSYGPRPAGSAAQRAVAERLVQLLPGGQFEPVPGGLRNIVGELPGREPAIVVAAHYDTTDVPGYLGANNSAAGVGAVVALARALKGDPGSAGQAAVRFVLFDGEEAPRGFTDFYSEGVRGSKAYVAAHAGETREAIVLDFIALHGEQLARDPSSDSALWSRLRAAAARVHTVDLFPDRLQGLVLDDHTPFLRASIPAIDLIDFSYACWQQVCDDLSQVSRTNLTRVGQTVLELLRAERLLGSARQTVGVTQSSIAGIRLGMTHAQARALLGRPVLVGRLENGYDRLVSMRKQVEAYFRLGARGVVVVTTWNRSLRTEEGIGPCSTVAALKKAYGSRLRPFRQAGRVIAYRLGNLVFTTEDGKRVGVVALGVGTAATYVALNAPECR